MTPPDRNPTPDEVLAVFEAECAEKAKWLETFSSGKNKWPDHEIDRKAYRLWVFSYVAGKQRAAIEARKSA